MDSFRTGLEHDQNRFETGQQVLYSTACRLWSARILKNLLSFKIVPRHFEKMNESAKIVD